ncbi:helix-turn-helix transcriptional regulator [Paenibacillus sp. RUD330]|uniref:helix-turn-helix transcriptional regulator n=1 Tax=Paenibacillus sp. RUD330 TaxID=2023772 RepID=UPI000B92B77D|nr:helix-turn-helix transcriptional regulator [Paenibacillus sp. RUD330]
MRNQKLRKLRGDRSLHEMAKQIGIPYSTYAMIESGQRFPRQELRTKLAKHFGVSIYDLFFAQIDRVS